MTIEINLEYPGDRKQKKIKISGASIRNILEEKMNMGIPEDARIFINTLPADLDSQVNVGDIVHIFPPITIIKEGTTGIIMMHK